MLGINAGITRTTEIWADAIATVPEDEGASRAYGAGIKQIIGRTPNAAFAVTASIRKLDDGYDAQGVGWKSLGAVASLCVDDSCNFLVSGALQELFSYREAHDGEQATMLTLGVSVGGSTSRVLAELVDLDGASIGFLGARFGNRSAAFDLGFGTALGEGGGESLPWLGLTGRL
jgi:hypothetical protein